MLATLEEGKWPSGCNACEDLLKSSFLENEEGLLIFKEQVEDKVAHDLKVLKDRKSGVFKALDHRNAPDPEPVQKRMKEELSLVPHVKQEPTEADETGTVAEAHSSSSILECEMSKQQLLDLHRMNVMPKEASKKPFAVFCSCCSVTISAKNRAKVWQHVRGAEHRRKWDLQEASAVKREPVEIPKHSRHECTGLCSGLSLNSQTGKATRLGSDLRPVFDEFVKYANLTPKNSVAHPEQSYHTFTHLVSQNGDWLLRHSQCDAQLPTKVTEDSEGRQICDKCKDLGSNKNFISRVCSSVHDLDMARWLHCKMYAAETVPEMEQAIKQSAIYQRRSQTQYDRFLNADMTDLHRMVAACWRGKISHGMTPAMEQFYAHVVKVCVDVEPWEGAKQLTLQKLLSYLSCDPNVTSFDMKLIKGVVQGTVNRHPAIHGMLAACAAKLDMAENNKSTMRHPNRP